MKYNKLYDEQQNFYQDILDKKTNIPHVTKTEDTDKVWFTYEPQYFTISGEDLYYYFTDVNGNPYIVFYDYMSYPIYSEIKCLNDNNIKFKVVTPTQKDIYGNYKKLTVISYTDEELEIYNTYGSGSTKWNDVKNSYKDKTYTFAIKWYNGDEFGRIGYDDYWAHYDTSIIVSDNYLDGCTNIGEGAFYGTNIEYINIPDTIRWVNNRAFSDCQNLKEFLPSKNSQLEQLSCEAFLGCTNLEKIFIPKMVSKIGYGISPNDISSDDDYDYREIHGANILSYCPNLTQIIVDNENPIYNDGNGSNCIIETATNKLICGCKNTIIPNTVNEIDKYAFCGSDLTSITIPSSVTQIGSNAFKECSFTKDSFINHSSLDAEANNYWGAEIIEI